MFIAWSEVDYFKGRISSSNTFHFFFRRALITGVTQRTTMGISTHSYTMIHHNPIAVKRPPITISLQILGRRRPPHLTQHSQWGPPAHLWRKWPWWINWNNSRRLSIKRRKRPSPEWKRLAVRTLVRAHSHSKIWIWTERLILKVMLSIHSR